MDPTNRGAWKYRNGPERTRMDSGMDRNGPEWTVEWTGMDRNGPEWTPGRTRMDTGMDQNGCGNGHRHGPEWTRERTGMDTGTDWNGPEDTMKSLALHLLFDIRIEKNLNIFT